MAKQTFVTRPSVGRKIRADGGPMMLALYETLKNGKAIPMTLKDCSAMRMRFTKASIHRFCQAKDGNGGFVGWLEERTPNV